MAARTVAMQTTLSQWLRLLFDTAPPLLLNSPLPFIAAGAIHLPPQNHWRRHAAAAAHAAAHLVHSPRRFDGTGLVPIARTLAALLEDARVESLAMRELPGLARLWRPLHTATPDSGEHFEALLQRLARALIDPAYDDPHAWVRKGRALFFGEVVDGVPALRDAGDVLAAARRLGHDIGQMRMQFNVKSYRVAPAYRDDHRWMWAADLLTAVPPPALNPAGERHDDDPALTTEDPVARYPEWDRLIARLRPDWCSVIEQPAPPPLRRVAFEQQGAVRRAAQRLRPVLRALTERSSEPQRSDDGEVFDPAALVDWQVAHRRHGTPESRVYRVCEGRRAPVAAYLLIDQSASTADPLGVGAGDGANTVLRVSTACAAALAAALTAAGVDCGIAGFSSNGRHAVHLTRVKALRDASDSDLLPRLQALQPGGSTRLGAALRHATKLLAQAPAAQRVVILLSDGEAYDIDVHDPRYLTEDARMAVRAAAQAGVRVLCLALSAQGDGAQRIFGRRGAAVLRGTQALPRALQRLLA